METATKNTAKKVVVVNKETKVLNTTKKASTEIKVSEYSIRVISSNKRLKEALASIGAVRSMLLEHKDSIKLDANFVNFLESTKGKGVQNKLDYERLNTLTRRTKTGKVPPFYVLQALNKICYPKKA